jgi:hypothetical protein
MSVVLFLFPAVGPPFEVLVVRRIEVLEKIDVVLEPADANAESDRLVSL